MEKELNYLSEKIEEMQVLIDFWDEKSKKYDGLDYKLIADEYRTELELLNNILNALTIAELN